MELPCTPLDRAIVRSHKEFYNHPRFTDCGNSPNNQSAAQKRGSSFFTLTVTLEQLIPFVGDNNASL
jgi:hypothetical protein